MHELLCDKNGLRQTRSNEHGIEVVGLERALETNIISNEINQY